MLSKIFGAFRTYRISRLTTQSLGSLCTWQTLKRQLVNFLSNVQHANWSRSWLWCSSIIQTNTKNHLNSNFCWSKTFLSIHKNTKIRLHSWVLSQWVFHTTMITFTESVCLWWANLSTIFYILWLNGSLLSWGQTKCYLG